MQRNAEERSSRAAARAFETYLGPMGVTTVLGPRCQHGLIGGLANSPMDASYLADTVFLQLRYFEADGKFVRRSPGQQKNAEGST